MNEGVHMSKRMMARAAAVLLAVGGSLGAAGGAAVANAAPDDCSGGRVCVYDNINYSTQLGWRAAGFALQDISSGNNDKMSSWSNNSGTNACWYTDANGGGVGLAMNQYTDNHDVGWPWNDSMSSWKARAADLD